MKICIVGLGAVGGFFAARLARSGRDVSALARGATLQAVNAGGLRLIERVGDGEISTTVPVNAVEQAADLGAQDLVVLTVKTTGLEAVVRTIGPLIGPETTVLSAMNGVPWWFFYGLGPALASLSLRSVDATGAIAAALPAAQVLGCVTHLSASCPQPGVVRQGFGERLIIGEPDGRSAAHSERCRAVADAFSAAAFQVEVSARIQQDIWFKLWGNMTMNPISAITGATGDRILDDDLVRNFTSRAMLEAVVIGERIGLPITIEPEERHAVTRKLGAFKTSMLQDVEARRPVELDALVASVLEIAGQVGVPAPNIEALFGLARLQARTLGLY